MEHEKSGCSKETSKHPSPEDCLPEGKLEKLREKMREANELLLDYALDDSRTKKETYRKVFDGLIGIRVEITNDAGEQLEGIVSMSCFDFVVLQDEDHQLLVPYQRIELIKPFGRFAETTHDPRLIDIDANARRRLTSQFGEVVANSPELIQLFFRLPLTVYLLQLLDKTIQVAVTETIYDGQLMQIDKDSIVLKVDGERKSIGIDNVSYIRQR